MGLYWATAAILVPYLVLAWFLGIWLHLRGANLWILRGGLALLGLLAAGVFFWFYQKIQAEAEEPVEAQSGAEEAGDIDNLVRDSARKLRSSSLGSSARLGKLPLVFLLGDSGSAKTYTIVNSGLDPELLAGHVYQDNQILPTQTANFWYTRQAIFADLAGGLLSGGKQWSRLVQLLRPGRVSSALQKGRQAPRAALVCFDCGRFLEERASESVTATARQISARLQQVSQLLGISFPVYVLFTKLDRISFFTEYVRNFSKEESNSVLGSTLPVRPTHSAGVYADEETRRLEKAFDEIFYSLSARRLELLTREHEDDKRPLAYEFPRELKKIRKLLVTFLVDMARPSQLQVNPFLRGFYFSGARPVVIDDVVAATPNEYAPVEADAGATRIFSAGQLRIPQPAPQRVAGTRKVPQWMFLTQFFNGVLLKDQVAFRTSGMSTRVSFLRRAALITATVVGLVFAVLFSISFVENRALEQDLVNAARAVPTVHLAAGQLASLSDLQQLESLRMVVARLASYDEDGPPWHMRWGLYVGDALYPDARRVYFQHFDEMLFRQTQGNIMTALHNLKDKPGPGDLYDKPYNELKAYLITTSNPDKSTVDFLSPVLLSHWTNGREVDPERADLAHKQFDFYSSGLPKQNPFSPQNEARQIAQARTYLGNFQQIDRLYGSLLAEADKQAPAVSFNEQYKDSASVLVSNERVRGAFTPGGADFMKKAIPQPSRYVSGEQWVLGPAAAQQLDTASFEQKLMDRYTQDYIAQWRSVIQKAQVRGYSNVADANVKLGKLTDTTSPLLEFFWFVSQNTNADLPSVRDVFQPSAAVVPPGAADKPLYRSPSNDEYINALSTLQISVNTLEKSMSTTDPNATKPLMDAAATARQAVAKFKGKFHLDPDTAAPVHESVPRLLLEPIVDAENLAGHASGEAVNAAGKNFCQKFNGVFTKFPFDQHATQELTLAQLNDVLAPKTGSLWTLYSSTLSSLIVQQGPIYVAAPSAKVSPRFVDFFRRAASLSDSLYPGGSPTPRFAYTVSPLPSNVDGVTLKVGTETIAQSGPQKTFYWTGSGNEDVDVSDKSGGSLGVGETGTWAIYRFVDGAAGNWPDLEWVLQTNGHAQHLPDGRIKSFKYHFQVSGFNPLKPGELSHLQCVGQIVP
jgi:type VI secretion system protein ImpL